MKMNKTSGFITVCCVYFRCYMLRKKSHIKCKFGVKYWVRYSNAEQWTTSEYLNIIIKMPVGLLLLYFLVGLVISFVVGLWITTFTDSPTRGLQDSLRISRKREFVAL